MSKSIVKIQPSDGSGDIHLDVTKDYSVTSSATLTDRPVDSGKRSISDHYQVKNESVSLNGVIVSSDSFSTLKLITVDPQSYVQRIKGLMKDAILCLVELPDSPHLMSCAVTNFSYSKNSSVGSCLTVSITLTQTRFVLRGKATLEVPKAGSEDKLETVKTTGTTGTVTIKSLLRERTGLVGSTFDKLIGT